MVGEGRVEAYSQSSVSVVVFPLYAMSIFAEVHDKVQSSDSMDEEAHVYHVNQTWGTPDHKKVNPGSDSLPANCYVTHGVAWGVRRQVSNRAGAVGIVSLVMQHLADELEAKFLLSCDLD